jgi:HK97 family phage major capsid protein
MPTDEKGLAELLSKVAKDAAEKAITAMKADRTPATPTGQAVRDAAIGTPGLETETEMRDEKNPGIRVSRFIATLALANVHQRTPVEYAKHLASHDRRYSEIVPHIEKAMSAGVGSEGGYGVPTPLYADFIDLLRPRVVCRAAGATVIPVPSGVLNMGRMDSGATATYVGENVVGNASQPALGQLQFSAKKLLCLIPLSNDFIRRAQAGAEAMVQKELRARAAIREDLAFLRGDGGSNTPRGLLSLTAAGNQIAQTAVPSLANTLLDVGRLMNLLDQANTPMIKPAWAFHPRTKNWLLTLRDGVGRLQFYDEMMQGKFFGLPYFTSTQIPINLTPGTTSEIYLFDASEFLIGDTMQLQVEAVNGAAYVDSTGTLVSGFSADQTVLKLVSEHDTLLQHSTSCAILTGVTWGA